MRKPHAHPTNFTLTFLLIISILGLHPRTASGYEEPAPAVAAITAQLTIKNPAPALREHAVAEALVSFPEGILRQACLPSLRVRRISPASASLLLSEIVAADTQFYDDGSVRVAAILLEDSFAPMENVRYEAAFDLEPPAIAPRPREGIATVQAETAGDGYSVSTAHGVYLIGAKGNLDEPITTGMPPEYRFIQKIRDGVSGEALFLDSSVLSARPQASRLYYSEPVAADLEVTALRARLLLTFSGDRVWQPDKQESMTVATRARVFVRVTFFRADPVILLEATRSLEQPLDQFNLALSGAILFPAKNAAKLDFDWGPQAPLQELPRTLSPAAIQRLLRNAPELKSWQPASSVSSLTQLSPKLNKAVSKLIPAAVAYLPHWFKLDSQKKFSSLLMTLPACCNQADVFGCSRIKFGGSQGWTVGFADSQLAAGEHPSRLAVIINAPYMERNAVEATAAALLQPLEITAGETAKP